MSTSNEDAWFYLSFADGSLPTGQQFLGGAYVRGVSATDAVRRSHGLGINPGGEVEIRGPLPTEVLEEHVLAGDRERLLTEADIKGSP